MTARNLALNVLYDVFKNGAFVSLSLKKNLSLTDLSNVDRSFATELVYGVVKNKTRLDFIISKYSKQKLKKLSDYILLILRMGVYQIIFLDKIPESAAVNESVKLARKYGHNASAGFVNAVLRNVARTGDVLYPKGREYCEIFYSHPKPLVDMLFSQYGETAFEIIKNNSLVAPVTVRVNRLKTSVRDIKKMLEERGIFYGETTEEYVLKISGYGDISSLDLYKDGYITPQGLSSYIDAKLVDPKEGEVIFDLAAAPGGKTTALAEMSNDGAKIYAFDLYEHKINLINKNCDRLGIKNVSASLNDSTLFSEELAGRADKVLADVVCSGIGIIRKKPDIKWNRDFSDFSDLLKIQSEIIENASRYLKKGGKLVYSTCTLNKSENEDIIRHFLKEHDFSVEYEKTILPGGDFDGFYICSMIKE